MRFLTVRTTNRTNLLSLSKINPTFSPRSNSSQNQNYDGSEGSKVHNSIFISRNSIFISSQFHCYFTQFHFYFTQFHFHFTQLHFHFTQPQLCVLYGLYFVVYESVFFLKNPNRKPLTQLQINPPVPISSILSSTRLFFNMCSTRLTDYTGYTRFFIKIQLLTSYRSHGEVANQLLNIKS